MTQPLTDKRTTPEEPPRPRRGRPRVSSREMLEEAALDLFIENGYAKTTINHITRRAGVSRGTFFNYFHAKGDVFWGQVDESLAHLEERLAASDPSLSVVQAIGQAFADIAQDFGPGNVPWILTNYSLLGSLSEIQASAVSRFAAQTHTLRHFAASRLGVSPESETPRIIAYSTVSAVIAAAQIWAAAGNERGHLSPYILHAIEPLEHGFKDDK
ncbi:TetR family transcriptional regulator [Lysinibacter sp. HNR]|uniref:acyl-CoA-like ligand-binding transcription factor n=1 Tax=Lysinibacter sp. HNR TaxID=3031408 RepID=UPI002435B305|nr:TetR family transcriptional regulator [Lysinibacter sp. HNR]WGD36369.1 TetR family transcriptional regulator [Lysinibacter sp. HNR]